MDCYGPALGKLSLVQWLTRQPTQGRTTTEN